MSPSLEVPQLHHSLKISAEKTVNTANTRNILKSKENIFKSKCNKAFKNKLKKYKLRKDGKEDDDIIDVSKILISSLQIKSPNGQEARLPINKVELEERLPKNYLFKMVRKRNDTTNAAAQGTPSILESKHALLFPLPDSKSNESKHTNAFQLLMDSRNKSIGGNSPGKEQDLEVIDETEQIRKKEIKAKRNLVLQKMAQKKGQTMNQENEEFIDECIKKKLEKRADRLKEMITLNTPKTNKTRNGEMKEKSNINNRVNKEVKENTLKSNQLQLFNFLGDDENCVAENHNSKMSNEDEEFLKKLGPSIKKKENMLSYFQKVEKKDISGSGSDIEINDNNNSEHSVIKVKFVAKHKKKKVKDGNLRSEPKVNTVNLEYNSADIIKAEPDDELNKSSINSTPTRKRKRDKITHSIISETEDILQAQGNNVNRRPKRNAKKPVKYTNDAMLSSSDDELIFTPIKKKHINKNLDCKDKLQTEVPKFTKDKTKSTHEKSEGKSKKAGMKVKVEDKKPIKLAPIFSTKSKLTPSEQAAKESFLKSGVPDKLKLKHKESINIFTWNNYVATVHVQQQEECREEDNIDFTFVELNDTADSDKVNDEHSNFYSHLINGIQGGLKEDDKISLKHKPENLLSHIKKNYAKFPVYRTFHSLKTKSKAEIKDINASLLDNSIEIVKDLVEINNDYPDKLSWNEKYKPMSSKQIIGNFDSVKELKRWLESWSESQNTKGSSDDSDLSDFCFSDSDTNSKDPYKHTNNVLIISGRSGTGKTSCVYAVAAELSIKVIEVNASSKRTGKIMLQDLQEATQSHKVNRGNNKKECSQNFQGSQENCMSSKIFKKRGRPKKTYNRKSKCAETKEVEIMSSLSQQSQTSSQESSRTESSLILIDDADIVFDQDDGFCSAISQLINYSKRPVILITTSLTCPHLQKFISCGKIIKMNPFLPRMLGTWLDILCLADTNTCYPGFGCRILDYFRGDIRKTINFLQFNMTSDKHLYEIKEGLQDADFKANIDDENSSMSWADQDSEDATKEVDDKEIKRIVNKQMLSLNSHNFDLFNVWWSMSNQFKEGNQKEIRDIYNGISLGDASRILDNISFVDLIDINVGTKASITSKPWESFQSPSVMERENMDSYSDMYEINGSISREIIEISTSSIENWTKTLICSPSMSTQRKRNKIVSQHNTLSRYLSPSSTLDRRALSLDYWSSCRTICRLEKNKTDSNLKRNNRFCHYLKSLNILCKNDNFDDLCEGLN